jgi:TolB protein
VSWGRGLVALTAAACGAADQEDVTHLHLEEAPANEIARAPEQDPLESALLGAEESPILFTSDRAGEGADLYVMRADGSELRRITRGGGFAVPQWSPRGDGIVFRRMLDGQSADIGLVDPAGNSLAMLTRGENPLLIDFALNWSTDGERISFASLMPPSALRVMTITRLGGPLQQLLPSELGNQASAAWSPVDASRLVYPEYVGERTRDLWVLDERTSSRVNLTRGRIRSPNRPRWSPDGTRIVLQGFALLPDGTLEGPGHSTLDGAGYDTEIFIIDVVSGELTRLTDDDTDEQGPSWAPDGESVLVSSDRLGDPDIWRLPLDPALEPQNLIDDDEQRFSEASPDWYWQP